MYNIRSIYCVYYLTEDKIRQHVHEYVDELIETWNLTGEVPISIVENPDLLEALQTFSGMSFTFYSSLTISSQGMRKQSWTVPNAATVKA